MHNVQNAVSFIIDHKSCRSKRNSKSNENSLSGLELTVVSVSEGKVTGISSWYSSKTERTLAGKSQNAPSTAVTFSR